MKVFLVNVIIISKSTVAIPALHLTEESSVTFTNTWFSGMYNGTPCKLTFVPIYSICKLTDFVVMMDRDLAASLVDNRMFHMV